MTILGIGCLVCALWLPNKHATLTHSSLTNGNRLWTKGSRWLFRRSDSVFQIPDSRIRRAR
jgi:hypothetical protein